MVLRGSKTHPEKSDIFESEIALRKLRHYLKNIDSQESEIEHEIAEMLLQEKEGGGGPSASVSVSGYDTQQQQEIISGSDDILTSIRVLVERLDYLEKTHQETEKQISNREKELLIMIQQFACGGMAGMIARTFVAPIDRVKLLIQTAFTTGNTNRGIMGTAVHEIHNGGIRAMWKGNFTNCIRVFPYAALQFSSYERYKNSVLNYTENWDGDYSFFERIISGACAGATAATLTYPLDVMRVRQAVYNDIRGPTDAFRSIYAEGGMRFFFKGWTPTLLSLTPFIAANFATFDYLKAKYIPDGNTKDASNLLVLGLGASAGLTAQTFCYPLDTIRRSMQLRGHNYNGILDCVTQIWAKNGNPSGFYKGIIPNAIKIVPNNGIRFLIYSKLTSYLGIPSMKVRPKKNKQQ